VSPSALAFPLVDPLALAVIRRAARCGVDPCGGVELGWFARDLVAGVLWRDECLDLAGMR
jgi:hypothetical protein